MSEPNDNAGSGSGGRLRRALARRIVWLTDGRRDASGETTGSRALVAVLGREHYSERRRQYPILSRRDLDGVLKQELAGGLPTLAVVSAARDDKRDVTFYEFKPEVLSQVAPAFMLVPESLALAATLPAGRVATVERAGFRYFLSSGGVSQPEGGAVTSADLFAMAAGLDASDAVTIPGDGLHDRIVSGLGQLKPETWLQLRMPSLGQRLADRLAADRDNGRRRPGRVPGPRLGLPRGHARSAGKRAGRAGRRGREAAGGATRRRSHAVRTGRSRGGDGGSPQYVSSLAGRLRGLEQGRTDQERRTARRNTDDPWRRGRRHRRACGHRCDSWLSRTRSFPRRFAAAGRAARISASW